MGLPAELAYLFKHALLRDAAYQLHLPTERAALHAHALLVLEAEPDQGHFAAELADHALAGQAETHAVLAQAALQARELRFLKLAAAAARNAYRHDDALRMLVRIRNHPLADAATREAAWLDCADELSAAGRLQESVTETAAAVEAGISDVAMRVGALLRLAANAREIGNAGVGQQALERAVREAEGSGREDLMTQALAGQARVFARGLDFVKGEALYRQVVQAARRLGQWPLLENSLVHLAALLREQSRFDEAWSLLDEAEAIPDQRLREQEGYSWANARGNICWRQNRVEEAERWYTGALAAARARGLKSMEGIVTVNLGNTWGDRGQHEKALALYQQGAQILQETGLLSGIGLAAGMCGTACLALDRDDEALAYFREAAEAYSRSGDLRNQSMQLANIGVVLQDKGNRIAAEAQFLAAEQLAVQAGATLSVASHRGRRAQVCLQSGRLAEAAELFASTLAANREAGATSNLRHLTCLVFASETQEALGNLDEARNLCREAMGVADGLGARADHPNANLAMRHGDLQELKRRLGIT